MTTPGCAVLQTSENDSGGPKRMRCPLHGCKRVYIEMSVLESHIKDHEIPAQSLPGKVLLCSSTGCGGSFSNMQKLMEHMRHHHKPNIYFQCESCRTKLRSYRGLLAHLHTCSKVPRSKSKGSEPTPPPSAAASVPNMTPKAVEQQPPLLESVSSSPQVTNPDGSPSAADPQLGSADPPVLGPPILPLLETPQSQLSEAAPQPPLRNKASNLFPSSNAAAPKAAADPPDVQIQLQTQSKAPEPAVYSPPGSSAVWKKSQGTSCNRRVLWEHTRGRYTCVQCGHTVTNRKEVTQHINSQHSGTKVAEDTSVSGSSSTDT